MKEIFVDTGTWSAIADSGDINHEMASSYRDEIAERHRLVVTNYILDELYTLMLMNQGYKHTIDFKGKIGVMIENENNILEVIWVTEEIEKEAWSTFEKFNVDKQWSFTDCVSYESKPCRCY